MIVFLDLSYLNLWNDNEYVFDSKKENRELYQLVPDSVSQNGTISVELPLGIKISEAKAAIDFTPDIEGQWLKEQEKNRIYFKPKQPLSLGKYYSLVLSTEEGKIKKDFLVQEDPQILTVIPLENAEANESSDITILFNRPMVSLSTLGKNSGQDIPIKITPETQGKYKWISTRTLQFIPEERLRRSSNYEVSLVSNMESLDGVPLQPFLHIFQTRLLRYENNSKVVNSPLVYNEPIQIKFNQPIDLKRTQQEIRLKNSNTNEALEFIADYGKSLIYDKFLKEEKEQTDESVLLIWQKKDQLNRQKLWDFNTKYALEVKKVYPKEGDIILDERRSLSYSVAEVISELSAYSSATSDSYVDLFDPAGKLEVTFYEDIDIKRSKIVSDKIKSISHLKVCKSEIDKNGEVYIPTNDPNCEQIDDLKKIEIFFKSELIKNNEIIDIIFEEIISISGFRLNGSEIKKEIKIVPPLEIFNSSPKDGATFVDLKNIVICSATPLLANENFADSIKSNEQFLYNGSVSSRYISNRMKDDVCPVSSFKNDIKISLSPNQEYEISFALEDVFNSKVNYTMSFSTRELEHRDLNFFHFQKPYNVTTPKLTELNYATQNMTDIDVHICKVSPAQMISNLASPINFLVKPVDTDCLDFKTDRIELPEKYWEKNYFTLDLKKYYNDPIGHFVLTFSNPLYQYTNNNKLSDIYERTYISVSNLSVVLKTLMNFKYEELGGDSLSSDYQTDQIKDLFWVTDTLSLNPVSGAKISTYQKESNKNSSLVITKRELEGSTNQEGILRAGISSNLVGVSVSSGNDSAIVLGGYDSDNDWTRLSWGGAYYNDRKIFLYTDRPIYNLSHEVFLKGIYRNGYDGEFNVPTEEEIPIKVTNSKNEIILEENVSLSSLVLFIQNLNCQKMDH
jgi:hypothetical protein